MLLTVIKIPPKVCCASILAVKCLNFCDYITQGPGKRASEDTYGGYAIKDVLKAAGCEDATKIVAIANDGYEVEFELTEENAPYSLVAIEKNKEVGEDGTVFFAPCLSETTGDYAKMVIEFTAE